MPTDKTFILHRDHEEEEDDDDDMFRKVGQWLRFQEERSGIIGVGTVEQRCEEEDDDWRRDSIEVLPWEK